VTTELKDRPAAIGMLEYYGVELASIAEYI
jgi:hypothetical protein